MKVAVYTIALNEAAIAERWANSCADADYRVVADTGSTDQTVERLARAGVTVYRISIRPWRFDLARNAAMALIPADVDVCCTMDMDRYLEPGWRPKLEAAWTAETTALFCWTSYRASAGDPTQLRGWPAKNFHHRWGYHFKRPVHEALVFTGEKEVTSSCNDLVMCCFARKCTKMPCQICAALLQVSAAVLYKHLRSKAGLPRGLPVFTTKRIAVLSRKSRTHSSFTLNLDVLNQDTGELG